MATLDGIRTLDDLRLDNQRVFIRADFDVPLDKSGTITNDARIIASLPTIKKAIASGARVILGSHLGCPSGCPRAELSLEPVAARLSELLAQDVHLPDDCIGDAAKKVVSDLRPGQVVLLENLRFHPEEEQNEDGFVREIASFCDVYVNDAFRASQSAHASITGLARALRDKGMGYLLRDEVAALSRLTTDLDRPFVALVGGAKFSVKIKTLEALLKRCDTICVGGALGNTLLAASGASLKGTRIEQDQLAIGRTLLEQARDRGVKFLLPTDAVVATGPDALDSQIVNVRAIPDDCWVYDIGPDTVKAFADRIAKAKRVFWSGPLGLFERQAFASGTAAIARALADSAAFTVVSGGDSSAAVAGAGAGVAERISFISGGGSATLEWIEGLKSPGLEALRGS